MATRQRKIIGILIISLMMTALLAVAVSAAFGSSRPASSSSGSGTSSGSAATGGGGGSGTGGRTPTCVSGYVVKDGACVKEGVKKVEPEVPSVPGLPPSTAGETPRATPLVEEVLPVTVGASVPVVPSKPQRALAGRAMALGRVVGASFTTMAWLWVTVLIIIIAGIIAVRIRQNKR